MSELSTPTASTGIQPCRRCRALWSSGRRYPSDLDGLPLDNPRVVEVNRRAINRIEDGIRVIPNNDLLHLRKVLEQCAHTERTSCQTAALSAALVWLDSQQRGIAPRDNASFRPRDGQIRSLRRLIFCEGDTILFARTGYGKSLIFHAYSVLTNRITLQIIPLSDLGQEQLDDINKMPFARGCLVTEQTKKTNHRLLDDIKAGKYTHVLLGPEQALGTDFKGLLRDQHFRGQIGLVAINKCHLVKQWKDFRAHFTMLGELRQMLLDHVVFFGCTATADAETERLIKTMAGFRPEGVHPGQTQVIRTSINRPDVFLAVHKLDRGTEARWDHLFFLLDDAVSADDSCEPDQPLRYSCTPGKIPKTIVYIDSHDQIDHAVKFLRMSLIGKHSDYHWNRDNPQSVLDVVEFYSALVSDNNRARLHAEFMKPDSCHRIMVATCLLGIGHNFPDVKRVVGKLPSPAEPTEAWQRAG